MSPFVKVFCPDEETRFEFWVVVFLPDEKPQLHAVDTMAEAEALAKNLAGQNGCAWSYQPRLKTWWNSHWWDANGNLRPINRIEFVRLDNGAIQFTLFSDSHRIGTQVGRGTELLGFLLETEMLLSEVS